MPRASTESPVPTSNTSMVKVGPAGVGVGTEVGARSQSPTAIHRLLANALWPLVVRVSYQFGTAATNGRLSPGDNFPRFGLDVVGWARSVTLLTTSPFGNTHCAALPSAGANSIIDKSAYVSPRSPNRLFHVLMSVLSFATRRAQKTTPRGLTLRVTFGGDSDAGAAAPQAAGIRPRMTDDAVAMEIRPVNLPLHRKKGWPGEIL